MQQIRLCRDGPNQEFEMTGESYKIPIKTNLRRAFWTRNKQSKITGIR